MIELTDVQILGVGFGILSERSKKINEKHKYSEKENGNNRTVEKLGVERTIRF